MRERKNKETMFDLFSARSKQDDSVQGVKVGDLSYGCLRYSIGENMMKKIAKECGAVIRIGKLWRFDVEKVDEYILSKKEE